MKALLAVTLLALFAALAAKGDPATPLFHGKWYGSLGEERLSSAGASFSGCGGFVDGERSGNTLLLKFEAPCDNGVVVVHEKLRIDGDKLLDEAGKQTGSYSESKKELIVVKQTATGVSPTRIRVLRIVQDDDGLRVRRLELDADGAAIPKTRVLRGRMGSSPADDSPMAGTWAGRTGVESLTRDNVSFGDRCATEVVVTPAAERLTLVYRIACGSARREERFEFAVRNGALLDTKGGVAGSISDEAVEHRALSADGKTFLTGRLVRDGSLGYFHFGRLTGDATHPKLESFSGTVHR